jgi:LysR family glycine cleavage system transcriptional activator
MAARKLPSLHALRAFEAAARHCSFTLAAQELCVTQGAVSHQIKALEEELGRPLFERLPNQLRLTAAGTDYLQAIGLALDHIERATAALALRDIPARLSLSCSPNFSSKWLVPRLGDFARQHPQLELRLTQSEQHVNFLREDIDAAIRYGVGPWPGLSCTRLSEEYLLPVCAPTLADSTDPRKLAALTLLHVHDRQAWSDWCSRHGVAGPDMATSPGIVFNHESAAIDAAIAGQGMTLARWSLVSLALRQGMLVAPWLPGDPQDAAYWLVHPEGQSGSLPAPLAAFRAWLLQCFAADRQWHGEAWPGRVA